MEHLRCVVERITYQNAQNGYSVIKCRAKNYSDLVTVVGSMPDVHVGSVLSLGGRWRIDAKYGRQFSMETFEETLPATVYGMEKYLGSGLVKGIGPKFAQRIVRTFGKDTLDVIEEEPDRLLEVEGIGKVRVDRIKKSWAEQKEIRNIMVFLQSHDVSTSHATRIFKTYGDESIKIVQENPYRLADDIWGIGFKTADQIAEKMGFGHEKYVRLRSGILYTLNRLADEGHCYADREMLITKAEELLSVEDHLLSMSLDEMIRQEDVITEVISTEMDENSGEGPSFADKGMLEKGEGEESKSVAIYLPPFYFSEKGTARRLHEISRNREGIHVAVEGLEERIRRKTGMDYDEIQLQAIRTAVSSKLLILTGGPGTGKTTTTLGIITAFRAAGARILLAAPTGRAAKRLSEATGMEAKTIPRLLEVKPPDGYQKNEEEPLQGDVLIVDECSMIDLMLMYNLLKAVPDTMTLILVGDIDQLPSVGAGNVLRDMIDSEAFSVVRLTRIFRQAQTSRIIMNAHRINQGQFPDIRGGRQSDFFFMDMEKQLAGKGWDSGDSGVLAGEAAEAIVSLVRDKLPAYYHIPSDEIQVLTPMQRGAVGAANLNQVLQEALNPASGQVGQGLRRGGYVFRAGDKVMQIRNNYDKEVFNGDIGQVTSVDAHERMLYVRFEDREISYEVSELDELVLAYATTIHKAQGSEYPIVVLPVMMNHYIMLQRNLIYTGITRAKKILVMVGTRKALSYAIRNVTVAKRNTLLKDRIRQLQGESGQEAAKILPFAGTEAGPAPYGSMGQEHGQSALKAAEPTVIYGKKKDREKRGKAEGGTSALEETAETGRRGGEDRQLGLSHEEWLKIDLFTRIRRSRFRMRFQLKEADFAYIREKGLPLIRSHAKDFVRQRLSSAEPKNDGKQTPMRGAPKGHPIFLAQHATGTCCRGCLEKWHGIPKGRTLTEEEQEYIVDVLMRWIEESRILNRT